MKKELSYSKAYEELQVIVETLQSDEVNLDGLEEQLKRAAELVKYCREKLRSIEGSVEETLK